MATNNVKWKIATIIALASCFLAFFAFVLNPIKSLGIENQLLKVDKEQYRIDIQRIENQISRLEIKIDDLLLMAKRQEKTYNKN